MNKPEKVVWTEGMFLRPHHFQSAESFLHSHIREWGTLQRPWLWGFLEFELDEALLKQGSVALNRASGLLPDGTWFSFHSATQGPPPLAIEENVTNEKIVLALPARRGSREPLIFNEEKESLARYITFEEDVEDNNALSLGEATLQFARLRLRLMPERELTAEWTAIGLVRVIEKRNDNQLSLDNGYIPPMLNAVNSTQIIAMANDLSGLLAQRSEQLGQRLQQPGRFNTSEMADFMLLALINRQAALTGHLKTQPLLHPETLWREWLAFAGEVATWSGERRVATPLPQYDHDNLAQCFGRLTFLLRQSLSLVMEDSAVQLPLTQRTHNLNVSTVPESSMLREFGFVLAVKASVSTDTLRTHFPAQMKIAPVTKIRDLVQLQLPGLTLRNMSVAPPQIPWHAGYNYFELEKNGELWQEMEKSGTFALHLSGDFPELGMELWAIRNTRE